jgi:hypothetical protein
MPASDEGPPAEEETGLPTRPKKIIQAIAAWDVLPQPKHFIMIVRPLPGQPNVPD